MNRFLIIFLFVFFVLPFLARVLFSLVVSLMLKNAGAAKKKAQVKKEDVIDVPYKVID